MARTRKPRPKAKPKKAKAPAVDAQPILTKKGRPLKIDDHDGARALLAGLGRIQATWRECAAVLDISDPSLLALFERWPDCKDAYDSGKESGKASLRRNQFALAEKNATMAIFLGMNYLGQKDFRNVQASGSIQHTHTHSIVALVMQEVDKSNRTVVDVQDGAGNSMPILPMPSNTVEPKAA